MKNELQKARSEPQALLSVLDLSLEYRRRTPFATGSMETRALQNVSFDLREGDTLALVGPSGSGKSSLARCLLLLERPTGGRILYKGEDVVQFSPHDLKSYRKEIHLIFQDSASALNPRLTVEELVTEPWLIHSSHRSSKEMKERLNEVLDLVEIGTALRKSSPLKLSGGQRQRVALARALVVQPRVLILDEALASLDLSAQAQLANLLLDLQERQSLAYLFVTHDLRMAGALARDVAVLDTGRIVHRGVSAGLLTGTLQTVS